MLVLWKFPPPELGLDTTPVNRAATVAATRADETGPFLFFGRSVIQEFVCPQKERSTNAKEEHEMSDLNLNAVSIDETYHRCNWTAWGSLAFRSWC